MRIKVSRIISELDKTQIVESLSAAAAAERDDNLPAQLLLILAIPFLNGTLREGLCEGDVTFDLKNKPLFMFLQVLRYGGHETRRHGWSRRLAQGLGFRPLQPSALGDAERRDERGQHPGRHGVPDRGGEQGKQQPRHPAARLQRKHRRLITLRRH